MLSIRLSRVGKKKTPVYRVVVMPKHNDPWAPTTEILGHYNPCRTPHEFFVKADRVKYWLEQGAQATDTVWNLLVDQKIIEGKKRSTSHLSDTKRAKMTAEEEKAKADAAAAKAKKEEAAAKAKEAAKAEAAATPAETPADTTTEEPKA